MTGLILIFFAALFFPGLIVRVKSIASGRKGPDLFQPLRDVRVLFRKGSVSGTTTGIIFRIAPSVSLASVVCALLVLPFGNLPAPVSFEGDFIFFSYLLALGRFFSIIGALDTGSSFEGMGANREAFFSMLVEPAFFILMAAFAMFTGYTSFSEIFSNFYIYGNHFALIYSIIGFFILVQIAIVENSRVPVDDPKTHLELTMIHEVMILDYSGFDKALIHLASWLKFAMFGSLIFNVIVPSGWNIALHIFLFLGIQALFASIIGLVESFRAFFHHYKNPKFILTLSAVGIIAFLVILLMMEKLSI